MIVPVFKTGGRQVTPVTGGFDPHSLPPPCPCGRRARTYCLDYDFRAAVALLERWLNQYQAQLARRRAPPQLPLGSRSHLSYARPIASLGAAWRDRPSPVAPAFSKILRNSGNRPFPGPNSYRLNSATNATRIWPGTRSRSVVREGDPGPIVQLEPALLADRQRPDSSTNAGSRGDGGSADAWTCFFKP